MNLLRCGWQPSVARALALREDGQDPTNTLPSSSQLSSYETLLIKQVHASSRKNLLVNSQSSAGSTSTSSSSSAGSNNSNNRVFANTNLDSTINANAKTKRHSNSFVEPRPQMFSPLAVSRPSKPASGFLPFQYWHRSGGGIGKSNPSASSYYYQSEVTKSLTDSEEILIPEHSVGIYQFFCQPSTWSPAFASAGDFTIRVAGVFVKSNEIHFRLGVICCCIKKLRDGVRYKEISKRKSYVFHLVRSETQLVQFVEAIALQYIGHRLASRLPRTCGLARVAPFTCRQNELDVYGERVQSLLSELLSITEIGFNRLVNLEEPPIKNVLVREFFEVGVATTESAMKMTTSSCDARIERKDQRPLLPPSWINRTSFSGGDNQDGLDGSLSHIHGRIQTHHEEAPTSPLHDTLGRGFQKRTNQSSGSLHCVSFIPPNRWHVEKFADGAFTVELSGVSHSADHASFCISVLYYNCKGRLERNCVDRRFAEFVALAEQLEAKVAGLHILRWLPSKTLVRQLDSLFLEKRAELLQIFLEKLLVMKFRGLLDQIIPMIAEPNVRAFLQLPRIEWSVIPRHKKGSERSRRNSHIASEGDSRLGNPRLRATSTSASSSVAAFPLYYHDSALVARSEDDPTENDNQSIERLGTSFSPDKMVMFASPPMEFFSDLVADKQLLSLRSRSGIETTSNNAASSGAGGYRSFCSRARSDSL